jgi:toxin ParE1/3/4
VAEVKFTEQALNDLSDIALYTSADSPRYAALQVQKLFKRTEILETFPYIGRMVPELKMKSVRELI